MPDLMQTPSPGERCVRFVGDTIRFSLRAAPGQPWPRGWRACLRTNLGRATAARAEIIASVESHRPPTLASWHDIPLERQGEEWSCVIPLAEVGYFRAKAYAVDERGWQHWPHGPDAGINVQPAFCRTRNLIYCAFPRMFGPTKTAVSTVHPALEKRLKRLDADGYTVIPPSGKLRDLIAELPHIFETLGCHILHLLPVNPTPTTYARFGRFGSPYACQDLLAIDPALVEFDRRTTGVDQFHELAHAVHERGGRLFLDIVINHTGWGSTLQESHPEWFVRGADGRFVSPGAWGTIWEDLVEIEPRHAELRRSLGDAFLTWCRRGVDGFRCDAGYKVPLKVWQYVTARVRQEFPDTVFLLEGLGGAWELTERLLTEGGMQWAYSELFQNHTGLELSGYLDHALRQCERAGLLVHYSETHDNERLAGRGRAWSLLRNRLCGLASVSGAFGFTCGVEWLAPERINVHSSRGLAWGHASHVVEELAQLNRLLANHPCFFDGARLTRLSGREAPVLALRRVSAEGTDAVLVLANTDVKVGQTIRLKETAVDPVPLTPPGPVDLLGQPLPAMRREADELLVTLPPAAVYCLAGGTEPRSLAGPAYRRRKDCEALALAAVCHRRPVEQLGAVNVARLGESLARDPVAFLSAIANLAPNLSGPEVEAALSAGATLFPRVVVWRLPDRRRVVPIPPDHWLLVVDEASFRATLTLEPGANAFPRHAVSVPVPLGHIACFAPPVGAAEAKLELERFTELNTHLAAPLRFLAPEPKGPSEGAAPRPTDLVLLTNGRGGMARLGVNLGTVQSKYDCLLAANLHPRVPVDRHVFAKRLRVWVMANGFISPLDAGNLVQFTPGPPAEWRFDAHAGDGCTVAIRMRVGMLTGRNTTVVRFQRDPEAGPGTKALSPDADVRFTVRVDLEDRSFHAETKRNGGAEHHFSVHCRSLPGPPPGAARAYADPAGDCSGGFAFTPAPDRQLRVWTDAGRYHSQPEWCENIPHPVEQTRGQVGSGDAYSPGWFELPIASGAAVTLVVSADAQDPSEAELAAALRGADPDPEQRPSTAAPAVQVAPPKVGDLDPFSARLMRAAQAFVVRRDEAQTIVAGYPWFLDWGRDTLICARGLLAAGMRDTVVQMLRLFGRFERNGTLPNTIHGEDASNRDTSDAPLWYALVSQDLAEGDLTLLERLTVTPQGRSIAEVLLSIANGYRQGTPNGIRVDAASGLVWSPSHFTWMDTNYPAGTPREGYPVEIQALWIRLLLLLEALALPAGTDSWGALARRAQESFATRFWLEEEGYLADVLLAGPGVSAAAATPHRALRSNCLIPIALGLVDGEPARRTVNAARTHLVVPGALRSLAPLPVAPPLPIHAADGRLLNDPRHPYWGRYEGDEDTQRKPAYHNGTAWVWTFPTFCEALARAWEYAPNAVAAARAYLASVEPLLDQGCLGHLPEIVDGDAPHIQRGCDAQAWSVTETLRVWRLLAARAAAPATR